MLTYSDHIHLCMEGCRTRTIKHCLMYQYNVTVAKSIIGRKINGSAQKLHGIEKTQQINPYALNNLISFFHFFYDFSFVFFLSFLLLKYNIDKDLVASVFIFFSPYLFYYWYVIMKSICWKPIGKNLIKFYSLKVYHRRLWFNIYIHCEKNTHKC